MRMLTPKPARRVVASLLAAAFATLLAPGLAAAQDAAAPTPTSGDVPIPEKAPAPVSRDSAPTVTIRSSEDGDRIEEYREGGRITMVRVTPVRGVPYYLYDDDRNGRLDRTDADGKLSPVYYTIYEWD
jgi:hypothetical protein